MLTDRKDIINVVKETLHPLYKTYGLTHDDFKNVAREATNRIVGTSGNGGGTVIEIKNSTLRTALALANTTALTPDGRVFVKQALGETPAGFATAAAAAASGAADDSSFLDGGAAVGGSSANVTPGDVKVTLDTFKTFMREIREKQQAAGSEDISGRRQRGQ